MSRDKTSFYSFMMEPMAELESPGVDFLDSVSIEHVGNIEQKG